MALKARPRVLIGFADALAAPEAAFSLLEAGYEVAAFARRGRRAALARAHAVTVHEVTPPELDAHAAVADVRALATRLGAAALMPLDDAAVWLGDAAAAGEGVQAAIAGPTGARARLALDKQLQIEAAAAAGLPVPPTAVLASPEELAGAPLPLPSIVKPALAVRERAGRLTRDPARVCATRAELERAADAWPDGAWMLAQPLLQGTGEGLFGMVEDGAIAAVSAHRRLRMVNPAGSGSSACASAPVDGGLAAGAQAMLAAAGWSGLFMLEFLRDRDGVPWFMELNGRCWGSMALARRRGLEYPAWGVDRAIGRGGRAPAVPEAGGPLVCRHLGRDLVHLLTVLRGPPDATVGWPRRGRTLRDVLTVRRGERFYNWRRGEPAVFLDDTVRTVVTALAGKVRA